MATSRLAARPDLLAFGAAVRRARERAGWSQTKLAERAKLSRTHLGRLELAQARPASAVYGRLVAALGYASGDALLADTRVADSGHAINPPEEARVGDKRTGGRGKPSASIAEGSAYPPEPFTLDHFVEWTGRLVTDDGELLVLDGWQGDFIADVFAGYAEALLVVGEGNGKSTLLAALALYHLRFRQRASVPIAAASKEQCEILFGQAAGFVAATPGLSAEFTTLPGVRRIRCDLMGSEARVFASDDRTADGAIPTLAICDELHRHKDLGVYSGFRGKLDKRGGQIVAISTAGAPGSEFELARETIRQQATELERDVAFTRAASDQLVLHEYSVPERGDVEDLALVKLANPFRRITVEQLARKRSSPTMTLPYWRRFVCGLPTRGAFGAITEAEWAAAMTSERIPEGTPISVGLDVAWRYDTTAIVPYFERSKSFRLFGTPTILVPPRDGTSLDPNEIERALLRMHARNPIALVVMDPSRAEQLAEWIRQTLGARVIERKQTNAFAEVDHARFMEALSTRVLKHPGDPTFSRHVLNAVARTTPYGATRFDRTSTSREGDQDSRVIDALSAAAMVHGHAQEVVAPPPTLPRWRLIA